MLESKIKKYQHSLTGRVFKKQEKTLFVVVKRKIKHLKYGKFVNIRFKYVAHNPHNLFNIGDSVIIKQSRKYSRKKSWLVQNTDIVNKN